MSRLAALRPSFFEAYAATHLSATLRPALRFTLEVLSIRHPRLAPLAARADELLSAALLLLEGAQLRATSATLAEGFYALRRSPAPLGARRIAAALVFVVVLPYLRRRADRAHEEATGGAAAELLGSRVRADGVRELVASGEWRSVFRRWYPAVTAGLDGAELICNLLYLFGHTDYFSPALVLQRSVLRKVSPEEFVRMQERAAREAGFKPASLSDLMCAGAGKLLTIAKYAFFASIFAFRFVEYYHAAEDSAPREQAPIPPPPEPLQPAPGVDRKSATSRHTCPICHQPRVNPAACVRCTQFSVPRSTHLFKDVRCLTELLSCFLSLPFLDPIDRVQTSSGYVFCYLCILQYLEQNRHCPVTLMPASTDDIIRVYDDGAATT